MSIPSSKQAFTNHPKKNRDHLPVYPAFQYREGTNAAVLLFPRQIARPILVTLKSKGLLC